MKIELPVRLVSAGLVKWEIVDKNGYVVCMARDMEQAEGILRALNDSPITGAAREYVEVYEGWAKCQEPGAALNKAFNALRRAVAALVRP